MFNVTHIRCGISDSHNIISFALKGDAPPPKHRKIKYRSFKIFDEAAFSEAVGVAPFEVAFVFDDVDDIYWAQEVLLTDLLNEHAPVKEKRVKSQQCTFINSNLRKAAYKKKLFKTNSTNGKLLPTGRHIVNSATSRPNLNVSPLELILTNVVQEVPPPKISGPQSNFFFYQTGDFLKTL